MLIKKNVKGIRKTKTRRKEEYDEEGRRFVTRSGENINSSVNKEK